jgi:putative flavoprotein involved in K+ transport
MGREVIETVVIGGGQAGLATSYYLTQLRREHVVLERHRVAERWRSERWDSLTFQFPNWTMQLPGYPYHGPDPDGFAPRDAVVRFIEDYAEFIRAPIRCGVRVISLRQKPGSARFEVQTDGAVFEAANVVIATGPYQQPSIPQHVQDALLGTYQVHSSGYRNSDQLPAGAVLVIGSGASGCQIAEDLVQSSRQVFLAVGAHRRVPRRYGGRDYGWWAYALGEFDCPPDQQPAGRVAPLLTGVGGGHDVDLRLLSKDGVILLGHLISAERDRLIFAPDLKSALVHGDQTFNAFVASAQAFTRERELDLPQQDHWPEVLPDPKEVSDPVRELGIRSSGISAVIWATGFRYDFGWVQVPVLRESGRGMREPIHRRGVTEIPGVYFVGLQWLSKRKSSLMAGVGEDAEFIVNDLAAR